MLYTWHVAVLEMKKNNNLSCIVGLWDWGYSIHNMCCVLGLIHTQNQTVTAHTE